MCIRDRHILGPSWAYLGHICRHIFGISWAYLRHILCTSWTYLVHILGISWAYLGYILGISWAYLGYILSISWAYIGHISGTSWDEVTNFCISHNDHNTQTIWLQREFLYKDILSFCMLISWLGKTANITIRHIDLHKCWLLAGSLFENMILWVGIWLQPIRVSRTWQSTND